MSNLARNMGVAALAVTFITGLTAVVITAKAKSSESIIIDRAHVAITKTKLLKCHTEDRCVGGFVVWRDQSAPIQRITNDCMGASCRMNEFTNYEGDLAGSSDQYLDRIIIILPEDVMWPRVNDAYGRQFIRM